MNTGEFTAKERDLAEKSIIPLFFKLYIPAFVAMLTQAVYNFADKIFILWVVPPIFLLRLGNGDGI